MSSRTAHTVANTQRSGPHAKLFHTDGAAALGATEAASIKLCDAATESAAGVATRGSLLTFLQQEPPPRRAGGRQASPGAMSSSMETKTTQVRRYALQACTDVSSSSACVRLSCSALALPSMPVRAELTAHVLPQQATHPQPVLLIGNRHDHCVSRC